jgi:exportin-7
VTQCCIALDRIASFPFNPSAIGTGKFRDTNALAAINQHFAENSELLSSILGILFRKVLYEDAQNQWSISRPMFSFILLNPEVSCVCMLCASLLKDFSFVSHM